VIPVPLGLSRVDLRRAGVTSVVWATGYRPAYPWLSVPVLDGDGGIRHRRGVTDVPGLYAIGLRFQHRRSSTFIDGARHDAEFLAQQIAERSRLRTGGEVRARP
jgi:putative flavoprotein involved in K+ transport